MAETLSTEKFADVEIEKAVPRLGVIVFKCLAATPGVEDYDGDIPDEDSMEKAFYEFMSNPPEEPVDINHKTKLSGKIVAGWWFPEEHCARVAFRPDDTSLLDLALNGDIVGSSYHATVEREPLR